MTFPSSQVRPVALPKWLFIAIAQRYRNAGQLIGFEPIALLAMSLTSLLAVQWLIAMFSTDFCSAVFISYSCTLCGLLATANTGKKQNGQHTGSKAKQGQQQKGKQVYGCWSRAPMRHSVLF